MVRPYTAAIQAMARCSPSVPTAPDLPRFMILLRVDITLSISSLTATERTHPPGYCCRVTPCMGRPHREGGREMEPCLCSRQMVRDLPTCIVSAPPRGIQRRQSTATERVRPAAWYYLATACMERKRTAAVQAMVCYSVCRSSRD